MTALKDPGSIRFEAEILSDEDSGGAFVEFPHDVQEIFGTRGRVPVQATFDGEPYRGSMSNMGGDCHILIVVKKIRQKIGKQPGDKITVTLSLDTEPRVVTVPPDFQALLNANPAAKQTFTTFSYSNQRDYVLWIEDAKRPETRQRRMAKAVDLLSAGKRLK
jgi:Bacteriocin-protection, YdeI or OmpD-Associated/Domain of unknown function (DUF1905)